MAPMPGETVTVLASAEGPFAPGPAPIHIALTPASTAGQPRSLATAVDRLKPDEHIVLVLHGLRADAPPGALFQIYLNLPDRQLPAAADLQDLHRIGTLNFFGAVRPPGVEAARDAAGRSYRFDMTAVAAGLQARRRLNGPATITIQPMGTPSPDAHASIGRVEIVQQ